MPLNESVYRKKQREEEEKRRREQAVEIARGSQNGTNNNTTNPSTSSQNSTQTSQRGSQSPSSVDKLFESTARKYTNATANDSIRRNSRGQEVSGRERTRSAVNSPNASSSRAKEDTGKWARSEAYGALTGFNKELASAADFLLPDVITPKKVQNVLDYYRKADEEQQQKVQELRGDSKLREIAGTIGGETLKNIPSAAMAMLSGGTSVGAQVAGEAVPSLLEGARLAKTGNVVSRALDEVARTSGRNPMFWETFLRTVGPTYDNEIANGADPVRATMSAYANALLNAQIEIGGGIEKYDPSEVFWKAALRSAKEEGMEEVQQYAVENLVNKAVGSNRTKDKNGNTIETPWFSMDRGVNAVINPVDMAEQGFYGAAAGGLMSGGRTLAVNAVNDARNNNYRQEHPDFEEHAKDLIQRASVQGREGEMSTRAQNLAEEVSEQMAKGQQPTAYQMRELESAVATDEYYNQKAYENSSQERYNQAVEEGKADTVKQTGSADEYYGFTRGLNETEQRNYDKAKAVMGENASENSVLAVSKLMTGSESNRDIDTILLDPEARSAVEELAEVTLPINNVKARAELENIALVNQIANRDKILEQTHKDIRTNMSKRGGELFDENYDEAVKTLDVPNAAEIYENFFSRFYTAGTVEDADFEKTYNRIISPLVEDFGEDFGSKISQVFNHDFAQKVFAHGQIAMNSVRAKAQGRGLSVKASENPAGFTYEEEARKHISDREADLFTKLAERAKVHIRLVSSIAGGQANGSYDPETGVILIAADSDNKFITVFKHELTHHLKNTSPELYQKLEDFVFKKWYDGDPEKMEERVQEYQRRYNMRPDQAREEIIADASEAFFTDEGAINEAVTFNEKMARAIHDGIKSLLDTFLDLVDTDRRADKGYGDFLKDLDILRDAEKMWLEALNESVGKHTSNENPTEDKDIRYSMKEKDQEYLDAVKAKDWDKVRNMVDEAAKDAGYDIHVYHSTTENFTVFKGDTDFLNDYFYFSPNKKWTRAFVKEERYARGKDIKTKEIFLKAKNILDATGEKWKTAPEWFDWFEEHGIKVTEQMRKNHIGVASGYTKTNPIPLWRLIQYDFKKGSEFETDYKTAFINAGYDGIHMPDTVRGRENIVGDTYVVFEPAQAKSADLVTRDDNRKIIPLSQRFNPENDDIRYSLKDSDGNTLSKGQQEYFANSKVVDPKGNLKVMYHGSPNDFDTFDIKRAKPGLYGRGFYFTEDKSRASQYGKTYGVYLDIETPLQTGTHDITRAQLKNFIKVLAKDEDYGIENYGYGATVDSVLKSVWGKDDFAMLQDLNASSVGDFAEAVKLFNKVNGTSYDGIIAPTETIAFYPEQIKEADNKKPTKNPNIRFSMKGPIEETKDLLAVHNLKAEDLRGALDLGGFPMPSIAIIKAAAGHDAYGEYSAIFDKSTIDPSVTKKNEVYGGDAWTPTFPSIRYKANEKVRKKISDIYYKYASELGYDAMRPLQRIANEPNDALDSAGGEAKLKEAYKKNTDMMRMFLRINGKDVKDVINRTEDTLSDVEVTIRQHFIDALGEDAIREFEGKNIPNGPEKAKHRIEWIKSHKADVENAYADFMKKEWGFTDEDAQDVLKDMKLIEHMNFIRDAMNYLNNGKTTIRESVDSEATKEAIREKAKNEGYYKWVDDLLAGIEEKKGIRNNKDPFTNSGSRRSWEALHDEPTLLNIVRVMSAQDNGETFLGSSLKAVAQKRYKNISEIKADEGRLRTISEEEYKALMDGFAKRENDIITRIDNASPTYESNPFIRHSDIRSSIVDNVRRGLSKAAFLKDLQQYANTKGATAKDVDDIFDLVRDVANIPTGYFEAKPKRPATFGEVRALLAPSDAPIDLIERLKDEGVNVVQYEAENGEDRIDKLNQAAKNNNLQFSLKSRQNPNQLDFFDMLKGMGVDEENAKIGAEALADTGKLKDKSKGKKKGSPYNTLAVSFYEEMIQDGSATLVGHKFKNKHDLAQALQMYRDPRYETCRLLFLDKNNKIVMQTGITQRLPSQSAIFAGTTNEEHSRYVNSLLHSATKRGAAAFYTSHNHPSGDPTPSRDDYGVNAIFKDLADQSRGALKYRGQIVIDHNTYAYMSPGKKPSNFGEGADIYSIYSAKKAEDPLHKSDDESKRMGMNQDLRNQYKIAELLMSLNVPEDHATLLYLSAQLRGKAIQSMEISHFDESDSYHIRNEIIKNAKAFGAHSVVLGMNKPKDSRTRLILDELYENGSLLDVFIYDGKNGYSNFDSDESKQRGWGDLWSDEQTNAPEQVGEAIQYSLKSGGESRNYQNTISKLENQVKDLKAEFKRTDLKTADPKDVRIQAGKLIKRHDSNMSVQNELVDTFNRIFRLYKENGTDSFDDIYEIAKNAAVEVVNNISIVHDEGAEDYKAIKEYLKETPIVITEDMKKNITDFNDFRKRYFGKLKLVNGTTGNIDNVYMELNEMFPGQFTEDYVNPADQLYHMADVLDNYAPYYETLDGASPEMQDYVVDIAADIMETAYGLQTKKTFADKKYEEKVKAVAKARQKALESRDNALNRQKQRYEKKIEDLKAHNQEMRANRKARREDSEARTKLLKIARRLDRFKTTAAKREQIDALIGDLDLVAKGMTDKTLENLHDLRDWYSDRKETDPDFIADSNIEKKLERLSKKHIKDMDLADVRELYDVLSNIENELKTERKLINSEMRKDIKEAGRETIRNINNSKGLAMKTRGFDRFFINGTLSPLRQIRRVAGYNDNDPLYIATKELADGQRKMLDYQMTSWKAFDRFMKNKDFLRSINGPKAKEIEITGIKDGKQYKTKITPDIRMAMYLASMNADNLRHMRDGGVKLPDIKLYKKGKISEAMEKGTTVKFSPSMLNEITSHMTKTERAFAQEAYKYYNETSPEAINKVSEELKGYSIARVQNYYPIHTDSNFLSKEFEAMKFDGTIEGMGFLKERVRASNPIQMTGLVDELTRSIEMNSKYVGLAIPVRNFGKIYGVNDVTYTERNEGGVKTLEADYRGSVKDSISDKWGGAVASYIEKFMTDLQNGRKNYDDWGNFFSKLRSNYAGAVLTLNASVALKQAASYPTAAAVLGRAPLVKAMGNIGKVDLDLIAKYTPLQWYRSQGFSTTELGDIRSGNKQNLLNKYPFLNWIQGIDLATTRKLWKASEYYVQDHNKNLKKGTDEYYKAVADIYNRVIEETQPNYTTMQRPGLLRSDNDIVLALNMFKTQPYQNFNILYDSIGNYVAKRNQYNKVKNADTKKALQDAGRDMRNAIDSQIMQLAVFAAMTSLWALFRRKDDKYRDKEGNLTFVSYLERLAKDMLANSFAVVPFGSDIYGTVSSSITGEYYYGFSSVTDSSITDLLDTFTKGYKTIGEWVQYAMNDDPEKEKPDSDMYKDIVSVSESASRFMGAPFSNMKNLGTGIYGWVAISRDGKYVGTYEAQKMTFAKKSEMMDNLFQAYRHDKGAYEQIRKMMIEDGIKESSIDYYMKNMMKERKTDSEQREYDSSIQTLEKSSLWKDASADEKEDYKKILEKIAVGIEDGDTTPYTKYAASGLTEEQIILYKLALKKVDTPNKNGELGGTPTKAEREAAVRLLEKEFSLTYAQKEALKG